MPLSSISPEVASVIWSFVDSSDLVKLYCTFNYAIQRLLHARHAIDCASLSSCSLIDMGMIKYFFGSIRDVRHLELGTYAFEPSFFLRVLQSLNPRELTLGRGILPRHLRKQIESEFLTPAEEAVVQCFSDLGFPDLARFTPNLGTLHLNCAPNDLLEHYRFASKLVTSNFNPSVPHVSLPPTLTRIWLNSLDTSDCMTVLGGAPVDLSEVHLCDVYDGDFWSPATDISDLLTRFRALSAFSFNPVGELMEQPIAFSIPLSLAELTLGTLLAYPPLLDDPDLRHYSLTKLSISIRSHQDTNLPIFNSAPLWPPTLTDMDLKLVSFHLPAAFLPLRLTRLKLNLHGNHSSLLAALPTLRSLTTLDLYYRYPTNSNYHQSMTSAEYFRFGFSSLPRGLTTLALTGDCFQDITEADTEMLPPSLTSFTCRCSSLPLAKHIRRTLPACTVTLLNPIPIWTEDCAQEIRRDFAHLLLPVWDVVPLLNAIWLHYHTQKIFFSPYALLPIGVPLNGVEELKIILSKCDQYCDVSRSSLHMIDDPSLPLHTLSRLVISVPKRRNPVLLNTSCIPPQLTHLELLNVLVEGDELPPTLTYISSNEKHRLKSVVLFSKSFPSLRHLDTPLWRWAATSWNNADMVKLQAHLCGLTDVEWLHYLVNVLHKETRSNMRVTLSFLNTEGLLTDAERESLELASPEERQAKSVKAFKALLDIPVITGAASVSDPELSNAGESHKPEILSGKVVEVCVADSVDIHVHRILSSSNL